MAKPVLIGARSFRTQSSALEQLKSLLHRYQEGQRIADQGDHADLVALIERYDPALDAVGEPTKGAGDRIPINSPNSITINVYNPYRGRSYKA